MVDESSTKSVLVDSDNERGVSSGAILLAVVNGGGDGSELVLVLIGKGGESTVLVGLSSEDHLETLNELVGAGNLSLQVTVGVNLTSELQSEILPLVGGLEDSQVRLILKSSDAGLVLDSAGGGGLELNLDVLGGELLVDEIVETFSEILE